MENSSNNLYIYTDEHKQYRNNLAKKWRNDWKDEFTEEEINTFSPIQLQRLKKNKREKILGEAQQTNEYNEAHNAKVGARKLSQHELLNLLIDKGAAEEEARVIVFGEKKETTGTLETEIEKLVNDKKLQNYP
jgi:ERCC4-related helicase